MKANATHPILIEGHAGERGTNEENVALGERRAKARMNSLVAQGGRMGLPRGRRPGRRGRPRADGPGGRRGSTPPPRRCADGHGPVDRAAPARILDPGSRRRRSGREAKGMREATRRSRVTGALVALFSGGVSAPAPDGAIRTRRRSLRRPHDHGLDHTVFTVGRGLDQDPPSGQNAEHGREALGLGADRLLDQLAPLSRRGHSSSASETRLSM